MAGDWGEGGEFFFCRVRIFVFFAVFLVVFLRSSFSFFYLVVFVGFHFAELWSWLGCGDKAVEERRG